MTTSNFKSVTSQIHLSDDSRSIRFHRGQTSIGLPRQMTREQVNEALRGICGTSGVRPARIVAAEIKARLASV